MTKEDIKRAVELYHEKYPDEYVWYFNDLTTKEGRQIASLRYAENHLAVIPKYKIVTDEEHKRLYAYHQYMCEIVDYVEIEAYEDITYAILYLLESMRKDLEKYGHFNGIPLTINDILKSINDIFG